MIEFYFSKKRTAMNREQQEMLCQYMRDHHNLARNFLPTANARKKANDHWLNIANMLNASGPPVKDVKTWKKTWADLRYGVKKKMANNKQSINGTGGGPYSAVQLTDVEEDICLASGLSSSVNGLSQAKTFGASLFSTTSNTATTATTRTPNTTSTYIIPAKPNTPATSNTRITTHNLPVTSNTIATANTGPSTHNTPATSSTQATEYTITYITPATTKKPTYITPATSNISATSNLPETSHLPETFNDATTTNTNDEFYSTSSDRMFVPELHMPFEQSEDENSNINTSRVNINNNVNTYLTKAKLKKKFMQDACSQMAKSEASNNEIREHLKEIANIQQRRLIIEESRLEIDKSRLEIEKSRLEIETKRLNLEERRANFFS